MKPIERYPGLKWRMRNEMWQEENVQEAGTMICVSFHSRLKGAMNTRTPSSQDQDKKPTDNGASHLLWKHNWAQNHTSFQPLKLGMSFSNMLTFWASRFACRTLFFSRQQKNCLEDSKRWRENLTDGNASAICNSVLAAQDFKLKTQNPTSLPLSLC